MQVPFLYRVVYTEPQSWTPGGLNLYPRAANETEAADAYKASMLGYGGQRVDAPEMVRAYRIVGRFDTVEDVRTVWGNDVGAAIDFVHDPQPGKPPFAARLTFWHCKSQPLPSGASLEIGKAI